MLDIKFIRENKDLVERTIRDKQLEGTVDVDELLKTYSEYLALLKNVESHRALKNQLSKDVATVKDEAKEKLLSEARKVKDELAEMEDELKGATQKFNDLMLLVPNVSASDVPVGKDESGNEIVRTWGKPPEFDFEPKDHVDLGLGLDLIDIETASKVSGSRFYYLKNGAVLLQFALVSFVFETLGDKKIISKLAKKVGNPSAKPFSPVVPPVLFRGDVAKKMDRYDPIDDRYYFEEDDLLLVGSAEHTLGPMYMDKTLGEEDLPIRLIGYSTAFRREAGTYGVDTRGILRVHQFDKLEMESFTTPEDGLVEQELIVAIQEYLVQQLKIPYQVVMICTGDMGKPDHRQIDIECWMPGQNRYRETHTSDYMTDYQARRLNTKYKGKDGSEFVHMNDATAFAIGRTFIAILENYQQKNGSIKIPKVLQKYMSGATEIVI